MNQAVCRAVWLILLLTILGGCAVTRSELIGERVYFKHINDEVFWETIVVYGELQENRLRKPSAEHHSAFGHDFCMAEDVTYRVHAYIQGSGPETIKFTQHTVDSCRPIAQEIGFGESILFLSKNDKRGVWSTGSVWLERFEGEALIYRPADILRFLAFENLDALLSDYEFPYKFSTELEYISIHDLQALKERGILDYRLDPEDKTERFYLLDVYKYINLETLIENNW